MNSIIKTVTIGNQSYLLHICSLDNGRYSADLSTKGKPAVKFYNAFETLGVLKNTLQTWIINCHQSINNKDEKEVFEELENWDGVINHA